MEAEVIFEGAVRLLEHVYVRARAKVLLAMAGDDDDVDVVVEAGVKDALVELLEHFVRVSVDRRVVEGKKGNPFIGRVIDERAHGMAEL
jgi:hypothetical protein